MVITHLEPDILECEVKRALGRIPTNKANGGDEIPADVFQILKDDAVKSAAPNLPANLENSAVATGLEKGQFSFQSQRKATPKNVQTTTQLHLSHANKVMLKIPQARLQQQMNRELPDVQTGFRKGRGNRSNCEHSLDYRKSQAIPERHLLLLH